MLGFGLSAPVLPKLVASFVHNDVHHAALIYGVFGTVFAVMQFAGSPILGALSDQFGRKPVIVVSCAGLGVDYLLMALAPNLSWLFVGRIIAGLTSANAATAGAYIADSAKPEERAHQFGLRGAAFGIGLIVGPALGGVLGGVNPRLPFVVAALLSLANAAFGAFIVPESLAPELRRPFSWRRANPIGALKLLQTHRELIGLSCITLLNTLASAALPAVYVLYTGYRYSWGTRTVGLSLAIVGVFGVLVQALLLKPWAARFGDRNTLIAGLVFGAVGMWVYGLSPTGWIFQIGTPVLMLWGLATVAQSMMTNFVTSSEQGELQGAIGSLRSLGALAGPGLFTWVFASGINPLREKLHPGAPLFVAAGLLGIAAVLAYATVRRSRPRAERLAVSA